jgi:hypothetical protein
MYGEREGQKLKRERVREINGNEGRITIVLT